MARRLRNAAVVVAAPLLFLGLLEGGLRLAGYGRAASFWVPVPGASAVQANRYFGRRFFPTALARAPEPIRLSDPKPPGVYRIFVVGGSAAMGFPEPAFSFARLLEVLLEERHPETDFEVVNAAMTAINSHVVVSIVEDSARFQPDAFVVYLGNNEVVGPYGPGTVFGFGGLPRGPLRLAIRLGGTRLGQAFRGALDGLSGEAGRPTTWRGMEMFVDRQVGADDPRLAGVYASLAANLRDIAAEAQGVGAQTIFSTVAVNLRDCPPFASAEGPDGAQAAFEAGAKALASQLGREVAADFRKARDLDRLRFRADSRINETIRETAAGLTAQGVRLADAEAAFAAESSGGAPGDEWLLEHVHFRFRGAWALARATAEALEEGLPESVRSGAPTERWLSAEEVAERIAYTDWDRRGIERQILELMLRPPFTLQAGHDEQIAERRTELAELDASAGPAEALPLYERAVLRRPDDPSLTRRYAELLAATGNYAQAVAQWDRLLAHLPGRPAWLLARGAALREAGRSDEALADYQAAVAEDPLDAQAQFGLGVTLQSLGRPEEAARRYSEALHLDPGYAEAESNIGLIRLAQGKASAALERFDQAVAIEPRFSPAHNNRGLALVQLGRTDDALRAFAEATALDPNLPEARFHAGALLASLGRFEEAAPALEEALRLDPDRAEAASGLGAVWATRGDFDKALGYYQRAVTLRPDDAAARFGLAKIHEARGELGSAVEQYRKALGARPDYVEAMNNLGIALARQGKLDESAAVLERAVRTRPDFEPARVNLEKVRAAMGR